MTTISDPTYRVNLYHQTQLGRTNHNDSPASLVDDPSDPGVFSPERQVLNRMVLGGAKMKRSAERSGLSGPEALPPYSQRFTNFIPNKNKSAIEIPGYASVEDFLASDPEDPEASERCNHKNPKQEVVELITSKQREIFQRIDTKFQEFKTQIESSRDPEVRRSLVNNFFRQVLSFTSLTNGPDNLVVQGNKIISLFQQELDRVVYGQANRWLPAGPWPRRANKSAWDREWLGTRLQAAKTEVETAGQQAITRLGREINQKAADAFHELKRLSALSPEQEQRPTESSPPSQLFIPPVRPAFLPRYERQFTSYDQRQRHKNGLKNVMLDNGYSSVENFLASKPNDFQKSEISSRKNPKQEATELLKSGGYKKIVDHIESRFEFYKRKIQAQTDPAAKQRLSRAFVDEMDANKTSWTAYIERDRNKICEFLNSELDEVRFQGGSRWFSAGPWAYSGDRERWNREWRVSNDGGLPRLREAKEQVKNGIQKTVDELSRAITSKITKLSGDLQEMISR